MEDNIIKNVRNHFILIKLGDTEIKNIRNLFRLRKKDATKGRVIRDIRNLLEHEEEKHYYIPVRLCNFWSNNYIEYESNNDRNKMISSQKYLDKISPYLKDIINDL